MSALAGLRVLELTQVMAGPFCGQVLADMGADVVKVEPPSGDSSRRSLGFTMKGDDTAAFLAVNRNKRSLALDLKRPQGQEVFRKLAETADVVVENFRPGVMDALGIGYATVSARNPRVIYCSISGYGADGPFAGRPGLDNIIQGFAGLMSVTGFEGGEPVRVGIPIADLLTGLYGAYGVLAALQARERTGRGQVVETSLLESMVGTLGFQAVRYLNGGDVPPPAGNHHPINAPYGVFKTRDGYVTIGATGDKRWRAFCEVIDAPEFLEDPRFATNGGRHRHRLELAELIGEKLQAHTSDEWEAILNDAGIPCGPVYRMDQSLEHPQVRHREMVVERQHPAAGTIRLLGLPVKLTETPGDVHRVPPLLGQHTDEVLNEIGLDAAEIARLREAGIARSTNAEATTAAVND